MKNGWNYVRRATIWKPVPVWHAAVMWSFGRLQAFHTALIKSGSTNKIITK